MVRLRPLLYDRLLMMAFPLILSCGLTPGRERSRPVAAVLVRLVRLRRGRRTVVRRGRRQYRLVVDASIDAAIVVVTIPDVDEGVVVVVRRR